MALENLEISFTDPSLIARPGPIVFVVRVSPDQNLDLPATGALPIGAVGAKALLRAIKPHRPDVREFGDLGAANAETVLAPWLSAGGAALVMSSNQPALQATLALAVSLGAALVPVLDVAIGAPAARAAQSAVGAALASAPEDGAPESKAPTLVRAVVQAGAPLGSQAMQKHLEEGTLVEHLAWHWLALEHRGQLGQPLTSEAVEGRHLDRPDAGREQAFAASTGAGAMAPVVDPVPAEALEAEVLALRPEERLIERGEHLVLLATAERIPSLLREVGRLREITFRAVGEGTGREIDLDAFDQHYLHLIVWSHAERAVLGAFRLGPTDSLLARDADAGHRLERLYTHTLFDFGAGLPDALQPALELGRSFVRVEAQRASKTLLWMWRGIGVFISRNPQYRTLFGPVSISALYQDFSRQLMVHVFSRGRFRHPAAAQVKPRNPVQAWSWSRATCCPEALEPVEHLSSVVSDAEDDGKGVPLLFREYLKLGGRFMAFNVDPEFSGVIDGLVVVHLKDTDRRLLKFYMGEEGLRVFEQSKPSDEEGARVSVGPAESP